MDNKLINYFNQIMPLTTEEITAISETMTIKSYKKGSILLREGETSSEAYFVLEGCVRQYYLVDGSEKTNNFFTEEQWVVSIKSISQGIPSDHYIDCCTDVKLVVGNRKKEDALYKQFPKLESISRKVMEKIFSEQQEIMAAYLNDTPEQRYLKLLEKRPDLFQIVPQFQIASYIGVKPESLSRIRKRLLRK
ncbi:MAG: Crp/Fnr family transcriptional regulator [Chitinophagales bacterium]|jgi:CRP-like cAMP-binding protein|nr:Crp/Fnr family transcriptional regulator [Chitinophagales bacterium]HOY42515.1 Crp/Fnr family transcriptional regulator [Chitinophagales bacterium]